MTRSVETDPAERAYFLEQFRAVATDRVRRIVSLSLGLEADPSQPEVSSELARELHTLKGEARLVELEALAQLAHRMEDVLAHLLREEPAARAAAWDLLLRGTDVAAAMIAAAPDYAALAGEAAVLDAAVQLLKPASAAIDGFTRPIVSRRPGGIRMEALLPDEREADHVRLPGRDVDRLASVVAKLCSAGESLSRELALIEADDSTPTGIRDITHRAMELTGALLDGAREADREIHRLRRAQISELMPDAKLIVRDACRATGKRARVLMHGGEVVVDRTVLAALREALGHLLRNAVVHGIEPENTRIERGKPAEGRIEVLATTRSGSLEMQVSDDGEGVDRERIIEAAVRAGAITDVEAAGLSPEAALDLAFYAGVSTSDSPGDVSGRGIGLDVVMRRIEAIHGTVQVATRRGVGTVFRMSVPASAPRTGAVPRVLVAEDSPVTLALLLELVESFGYAAIGAKDGREAIDRARLEKPDVIVTDLDMPELSGPALLAAIRAEEALRATPLVVISVAEDAREVLAKFEVMSFLTKRELRPDRLAEVLDKATATVRSRSEAPSSPGAPPSPAPGER